ncbi:MAG: 4Fe-4S binding protein [Patescibacteria group bacterium]|nr:4Fe-4S binding protein [Patescibacteria group bacterium]HPL01377.1 4Fe-4S binding protein [bacterium]
MIISKNREREAFISPELCKGCGICIEKCPVGALKFGDEIGVYGNPIPEIDIDKCINCGNCFRFCPDCAIKVKKKSK